MIANYTATWRFESDSLRTAHAHIRTRIDHHARLMPYTSAAYSEPDESAAVYATRNPHFVVIAMHSDISQTGWVRAVPTTYFLTLPAIVAASDAMIEVQQECRVLDDALAESFTRAMGLWGCGGGERASPPHVTRYTQTLSAFPIQHTDTLITQHQFASTIHIHLHTHTIALVDRSDVRQIQVRPTRPIR